jgi:hypothetical protein
MKRIIMTAALAVSIFGAGTFSANAQVEEKADKMEMKKDKQMKFEQIKVSEVPQSVKKAVKSKMKRAKIAKAYKNESDQYKLELKIGKAMKSVYLNEKGEMIDPDMDKKAKMMKRKK